jgi:hypothetical protein
VQDNSSKLVNCIIIHGPSQSDATTAVTGLRQEFAGQGMQIGLCEINGELGGDSPVNGSIQ